MSATSIRQITNQFSGDVVANIASVAANNITSPAKIDFVTLASGPNTITPPTGAKAVTIVFPSSNTILVTLKGVAGDTGIALHLTDPTSIALDSYSSTFILDAAGALGGARLIWS